MIRIALCIIVALLLPVAVDAHELINDGNTGVVMHIDPDDDPIAGQVATFYLEFKDLEGKFTLNDCRCQVYILQGTDEVYFEALHAVSPGAPLSAAFQYKFPATGVYRMNLKADPVVAGAFKPFDMSQPIVVERVSDSIAVSTTITRLLPLIAVAAGGVGMVAVTIFRSLRQRTSARKR